MSDFIQHIDPWFLVLNKPAGLNAEPDGKGNPNVLDQAIEILQAKGPLPSNFFPGLPHRLDRPTSGLLLMTLRKQALTGFGKQFEQHGVQKKYLAMVEGVLEKGGKLAHWHFKNHEQKRAEIADKKRKGWSEVKLSYAVLQSGNDKTLVEIKPETGKYHQIRAQFSKIGHPILNDTLYSGKSILSEPIIALHAASLQCVHPSTGDRLQFKLPYPESPLWRF